MTIDSEQKMRLSSPYGMMIDRSVAIKFTFEGDTIQGYEGDTIASALIANDINILSRSFKYHRPRGVLSMAGQDANSLVQIADEPNVRADVIRIKNAMNVVGQNYLWSLKTDFGRAIELISKYLSVGFYYKAFYKPRGAWKYWEPLIRNVAGLGKIQLDSKVDYTDKQYMFADVVVLGGGPAGLNAAIEAANHNAEVIIIDDGEKLGGSLNYARFNSERSDVIKLRDKLIKEVVTNKNITVLTGTKCTGWFSDNWLSLLNDNRLIKLRAKAVVTATGSLEQPAVFRNNDLPGIMLGSAAQRLMYLYGVKPGNKAVVLAGNIDGYGVALDLYDAGIAVNAVIDMGISDRENELVEAVFQRDIKIVKHSTVYEAVPKALSGNLRGVHIRAVSENESTISNEFIECDLLCVSVGYTPAAQLVCHSGGKLLYSEKSSELSLHNDMNFNDYQHAVLAGSVSGVMNLNSVCKQGADAGSSAANMCGYDDSSIIKNETISSNYKWPIFSHPKGKEFIDFDEDLQIKDIQGAVDQGFGDLELVKRFSTVVMGPSQGRQSALNNLRVATAAANKSLNDVSITTQRPPFYPEQIQLLSGRGFQPIRRTSMHQLHLEYGAQMIPAGSWMRPAYYGAEKDSAELVTQEALSIRKGVGLIDVSTLGKLMIAGLDAAEFIHRIYTFNYLKQPIGKCRYVLMVDERGVITDDGVACRFNEHSFFVTATSTGVDDVYRSMLHWKAQWNLQIEITNVTSAFSGMNLAGPLSRKVLSTLVEDVDLSHEAFGFSEVREGHICGIPAYFLRVGFVGELGYEIHVPSRYGAYIWEKILEAGEMYNISPVGIEAQRLLRLEKGHIIVGQDTDGLTTPKEAAMSWAIGKKKTFFIGKRSLDILDNKPSTRCLIGFSIDNNQTPLPEECNLTLGEENNIIGRVTSISHSPILNKVIGLAYVDEAHKNIDSQFSIKLSNGTIISAATCELPFYDKENKRQEI